MIAVRTKILNADINAEPQRYRMIVSDQRLRPQLLRIEEPKDLRCYANVVRVHRDPLTANR